MRELANSDTLRLSLEALDDGMEVRHEELGTDLSNAFNNLAHLSVNQQNQARMSLLAGFSDLMMILPSAGSDEDERQKLLQQGQLNAGTEFLKSLDTMDLQADESAKLHQLLKYSKESKRPELVMEFMQKAIAVADSHNTNINALLAQGATKRTQQNAARQSRLQITQQASNDAKQEFEKQRHQLQLQIDGPPVAAVDAADVPVATTSTALVPMSDQYYSADNQQSFMSWAFGGLFRQSGQSPQQPTAQQSTPLSHDDLGRHRIGTQGNYGSCISV